MRNTHRRRPDRRKRRSGNKSPFRTSSVNPACPTMPPAGIAKSSLLTAADRNRRIYLMMEGAASVKDVYVNGMHIGRHKGPFSASAFDLTPALKIGQPNTLDVRVTNRDDETQELLLAFNALLRQRRHVPQGLAGEDRRSAYLPRYGFERRLPDARQYHRSRSRSERTDSRSESACVACRGEGSPFCH